MLEKRLLGCWYGSADLQRDLPRLLEFHRAGRLKLDELIRSTRGAHNALLDLEELNEEEINRIRTLYISLAAKARFGMDAGTLDIGIPDIDLSENHAGGKGH